MDEDEWATVEWEERRHGREYYFCDGEYEWIVRQNRDGTWEQIERWAHDPDEPWLSNGTADTAEAAKLIF